MKNKNNHKSGLRKDLAVERFSMDRLDGGRFVKQCCVCKKVKLGELWVNDTADAPGRNNFSHGYCPPCYLAILQTIDHYTGVG